MNSEGLVGKWREGSCLELFRASAFPRRSVKKQLPTAPGCVIRAGDSETDCSRVVENLVVVSSLQEESQNQSAQPSIKQTHHLIWCYSETELLYHILSFIQDFEKRSQTFPDKHYLLSSTIRIFPGVKLHHLFKQPGKGQDVSIKGPTDALLPDDVSVLSADLKWPISLTSEVSLPKK